MDEVTAVVNAAQAVVDDAYYSEDQDCCLVDLSPLETLESALAELRQLPHRDPNQKVTE